MNKIEMMKIIEDMEKNPKLLERLKALLSIVNNTSGDLDRADDAEGRLINEMNKLAIDSLEAWATTQEEKKTREARNNNKDLAMRTKKNCIGKQLSDK